MISILLTASLYWYSLLSSDTRSPPHEASSAVLTSDLILRLSPRKQQGYWVGNSKEI